MDEVKKFNFLSVYDFPTNIAVTAGASCRVASFENCLQYSDICWCRSRALRAQALMIEMSKAIA